MRFAPEIAARLQQIVRALDLRSPVPRAIQQQRRAMRLFPGHRLIRLTASAADLPVSAAKRMRQGLQEQRSQQPKRELERPVSSPPSGSLESQPEQSCA